MTSTIKVNTIQNTCGADIIKESSNTITIGASGDTVTLASGASQSGFGRAGSVNWQTSIKTANFTAASGEGYFCDTASVGAFNLTLPSSPSAGDIVALADYANTFDTAAVTVQRNGSNIEGAAEDLVANVEGASTTLVYADATKGWIVVNSGNSTSTSVENFISATGGTTSTDGNDKIHTFTGPGTFTVASVADTAANNVVSYLIVGSGGGGSTDVGGGGGAGGYREVKSPATPLYTASPLDGYSTPGNRVTVTAQSYPIVVGSGGAGNPYPPQADGTPGNVSSFGGISSAGGGGGKSVATPGLSGGSGGGGYRGGGPGGSGNTPSVTPAQGNDGGVGVPGPGTGGSGGGGGASAAGSDGTSDNSPASGAGGAGATTNITGSSVAYAGGGGGGTRNSQSTPGGAGGTGGGGAGSGSGSTGQNATPGTANTGGGGGGAINAPGNGGNGGSGIVVIRYRVIA
jgi:hypothetical protein